MTEITLYNRPEINSKLLLFENRKPETRSRIRRWNQAKRMGQLTEIAFCDDAKLVATYAFDTDLVRPIRSIAASGNIAPFKGVAEDPGSNQAMVLGHFDSSIQTSDYLWGCGGLWERFKHDFEKAYQPGTAHHYVHQHIDSYDVVFQTMLSASRYSRISGKPTMAGLWDNITYQIIPIGFFKTGGRFYEGIVPAGDLESGQPYEFQFQNLVPIDESILPAKMRKLLANNNVVSEKLMKDDRFRESQRIQNPELLMVSTSMVPFGVRYPALGVPNTIFKVSLPLVSRGDGEKFHFESEDVLTALAQAQYPISHTNVAKPDEAFHDTRRILIETPNIEASRMLSGEFKRRNWIKDWMRKGGQIMVAQVKGGITEEVREV